MVHTVNHDVESAQCRLPNTVCTVNCATEILQHILLVLPNMVRRVNHCMNSARCEAQSRWSFYLFHNIDGFYYYHPPIGVRRLLIVSFA